MALVTPASRGPEATGWTTRASTGGLNPRPGSRYDEPRAVARAAAMSDHPSHSPTDQLPRDEFLAALLAGDEARCLALAHAALAAGMSVPQVYEGLVRSTLYRVGELWETCRISVAAERMATCACQPPYTLEFRTPERDGRGSGQSPGRARRSSGGAQGHPGARRRWRGGGVRRAAQG